MSELEIYFNQYRKNIIGIDSEIETPFGTKKLIYADWIASGRLYSGVEEKMQVLFGPMVGNTHSESSETGVTMTRAYHLAQNIIKKHEIIMEIIIALLVTSINSFSFPLLTNFV